MMAHEALRRARIRAGMRSGDAARAAGVAPSLWSQWETGARRMSVKAGIVRALDVIGADAETRRLVWESIGVPAPDLAGGAP